MTNTDRRYILVVKYYINEVKRLKKIICFVLAVSVVMSLQFSVMASNANFTDVNDSDWFYPYIELLAQKDLVKGTSETTYSPSGTLMVDEFLAFVLRTMGKEQKTADGYWAQNYINEAIKMNLIDENEFQRYDIPISREKIAKIAVRASDVEYVEYKDYGRIFSDLAKAEDSEFILKAIELGVLAGYEDGTFRPTDTATRAEASTMIARLIDEKSRIRLIENVFYNPMTDLDKDWVLKKDKAYEFILVLINQLRIEKSASSTAVVKGRLPDLPRDHWFDLEFEFYDYQNSSKQIGACRSAPYRDGDLEVPREGEFNIDTGIDADQIGRLQITIIVTRPGPFKFRTGVGGFSIYKDFKDPSAGFFHQYGQGNKSFDFSLTKGMWGW